MNNGGFGERNVELSQVYILMAKHWNGINSLIMQNHFRAVLYIASLQINTTEKGFVPGVK